MIFNETKLAGAFIIDIDPFEDRRGIFARTYCQREFEENGLNPVIAQSNIAFNAKKGTLRGMHFQFPPAGESKLVRCTRGAILDIIVDMRPDSPTFLEHVSVELSAENRRSLFVPACFAHGYQALEDTTETSYQMGEFYSPENEGGLRYDDPVLDLEWSLPVTVVSDKDLAFKPFAEIEAEIRTRMSEVR